MSNIKLITFNTQQTIIAEIIEDTGIDYLVIHPVQVIAVPPKNANDTGGVGFAPYLAYSEEFDKGITIKNENVFCITTPVNDLTEQYRKMFSRIELAPAGLRL
jgi:hypothetical protein